MSGTSESRDAETVAEAIKPLYHPRRIIEVELVGGEQREGVYVASAEAKLAQQGFEGVSIEPFEVHFDPADDSISVIQTASRARVPERIILTGPWNPPDRGLLRDVIVRYSARGAERAGTVAGSR